MERTGILTLSELADRIGSALKARFEDPVWVKAEIHKLNYYSQSGHCYPDLVEKSNNKIKAQMRATIWAGDYQRINARFVAVARKQLGDSMIVLCLTRIQHHPLYGLSINILDIDPEFTLGALEHDKQQTIAVLKAEGIFHQNKKLELPELPGRLAIISVESSKGYQDFIGILSSKGSRFRIQHEVYPALLQGDKAVKSISEAMMQIRNRMQNYDAIAIIRGGGGDIGLDCYNHPDLARQIAGFPLPVLSGIGHSTNETIVEMISHTNLITPTDLAYFLLKHYEQFESRLVGSINDLKAAVSELLSVQQHRTKLLSDAIASLAERRIERELRKTSYLAEMLGKGAQQMLERKRNIFGKLALRLKFAPAPLIIAAESNLRSAIGRLESNSRHILMMQEQKLRYSEERIRQLDPRNVLLRGYSITRVDGMIVRTPGQVRPGVLLHTELFDGKIISTVNKEEHEQEN